ncbi:hypothetical protein [Promicromonospora sp. NPDC050249]|uniref:hypothetical protein n=1 Tax=Promicromonospora sp. NPDC050249 TaxID=3154743 RepID=UPI0033F0689D
MTSQLLALLMAGAILLAFFGGYLIGRWHADHSRIPGSTTRQTPEPGSENSPW